MYRIGTNLVERFSIPTPPLVGAKIAPDLGRMYVVMGNMYLNRYRAAPGYRCVAPTGPQHGELGDRALAYYQRAAEAFERMGLDQTHPSYPTVGT